MIKAVKAVRNKEMGYLAAAKLYNVLHCANTFAQIGTIFKLASQT
jgi:hypothetical protein